MKESLKPKSSLPPVLVIWCEKTPASHGAIWLGNSRPPRASADTIWSLISSPPQTRCLSSNPKSELFPFSLGRAALKPEEINSLLQPIPPCVIIPLTILLGAVTHFTAIVRQKWTLRSAALPRYTLRVLLSLTPQTHGAVWTGRPSICFCFICIQLRKKKKKCWHFKKT